MCRLSRHQDALHCHSTLHLKVDSGEIWPARFKCEKLKVWTESLSHHHPRFFCEATLLSKNKNDGLLPRQRCELYLTDFGNIPSDVLGYIYNTALPYFLLSSASETWLKTYKLFKTQPLKVPRQPKWQMTTIYKRKMTLPDKKFQKRYLATQRANKKPAFAWVCFNLHYYKHQLGVLVSGECGQEF